MVRLVPLLILSDAVSSSTGLGRIAREIAVRADEHLKDVCRIATLGYGGPGSCKFRFTQYAIEGMSMSDFLVPNLPQVWQDFAGTEPGVLLAIWDASRLGWFSRPNVFCSEGPLRDFLTSAKMERWIYCPIDAEGPGAKLPYASTQALLGFDRILAYGGFGENLVRQSLGDEAANTRDLASIPHGIDRSVFYPRDRHDARINFYVLTGAQPWPGRGQRTPILDDEPLIGTIATNQPRKDWGLWGEACRLFLERYPKARFWMHIDETEGAYRWSIPQLLFDFALLDRTLISQTTIDDDKMAQAYSAADLTLGIGAGEGWGFPLGESLACGTPVIHVNYGGGAEVVPKELLVEPVAYRFEGQYCSKRPVMSAQVLAEKMHERFDEGWRFDERASLDPKFDWLNVWPQFEAWFRKGLKQ